MPFEYSVENCGRVKMARGTFQTYYDLAAPIYGVENPAAAEIIETHDNFRNLRNRPPFDLLLAFFPDDYKNIQYRLRGAGAYRHLRIDQGPGGNFTRFDVGTPERLHFDITGEKGFAMPEALISEQLEHFGSQQIRTVASQLQNSFENNDYKRTAALVNKFTVLAEKEGLKLHTGENVGSKSGFFFIRPAETNVTAGFPIEKIPQLRAKIDEAVNKTFSLAEYAREDLRSGTNFARAVERAEQKYEERGGCDYTGEGLLYFQPDCFVDNQGNIEIEKINMPDVGMFLTMLNRPQNSSLQKVVDANLMLKDRLKQTASKFLTKDEIVLVTRDEVIDQRSDTLEILEIKALSELLESIGKTVKVKKLSEHEEINKNSEILLLNVDGKHKDFAGFAEDIVRRDIRCYPEPTVCYFKDRASTLQTMKIPHKYMEQFMQLIKPKEITSRNAENIYNRLQYVMKRFGMDEDIVYANISGYRMPIPVFKYSLHSFGQIYKACEKVKIPNQEITLSKVPVHQDNAVFFGQGKPRLSAFRFMCCKER